MQRVVLCHYMVLVFTMISLCSCSPRQVWDENDVLIVGMELAYPPFEMTTENNEPTGISVEMASALGKFLEREVRIENIPFDGLIPALKTGKIDIIISSMTATEERAESVDFSIPYLKTGLCLLVAKDSTIKGIEDLADGPHKIAVKKGTTGHQFARQNLTEADLLVLDKETSAVMEVVQSKAEAFIFDQMSTYQNWKRHPDSTRAILKPFKEESWAVAVRKGQRELLDSVNDFLRQYKSEGGFDILGEKYLSDQKQAFKELGIEFYF